MCSGGGAQGMRVKILSVERFAKTKVVDLRMEEKLDTAEMVRDCIAYQFEAFRLPAARVEGSRAWLPYRPRPTLQTLQEPILLGFMAFILWRCNCPPT